ncbi:transcription elongation factor TFIIS [Neophaeococcomyces mojaviensis]|uniref:Transcription elongation factor TFIIS n=1 Tax=Neophaeococcomyces mojaviensis TaxID=3383035 RepID=A0ACC3A7Y6_9EURO|nr:transcription elongation factor TFIIS [Knufia sp. JES_112]
MAMDEREVRSKGDALQKALSSRETAGNVLNILKELQKGVKPSEDLLRKTQIGKIVNKVKGLHGVDPAIPRLASEIISQWRNSVNKTKQAPASGSTTPNGTKSPAPVAPSSQSKTDSKLPTGVPLDKRSWKTDKIDKSSLTSEAGRNNSIGLLYDSLVVGSSLPPSKVLDIARQVELAVYNLPAASAGSSSGPHTSDFYKEKIRSLYQNLKNKANPDLRQRVVGGQISPSKIASMTHEEMKSDQQQAEDEKLKKENLSNAMVPKDEKSISDHLECGRCKKKMVSFTQAQTRSADEPMTTFCECMNCGNRWKFS